MGLVFTIMYLPFASRKVHSEKKIKATNFTSTDVTPYTVFNQILHISKSCYPYMYSIVIEFESSLIYFLPYKRTFYFLEKWKKNHIPVYAALLTLNTKGLTTKVVSN